MNRRTIGTFYFLFFLWTSISCLSPSLLFTLLPRVMRSTWRFNFPSPSEKKNHSYIRNEFVTENEYGKKDKTQTNPVYFGCFYSSFFQMRQRIPPIVEPVYSLTWHLVAPENRRPVSTYPGKRKKKGILVFNYCKTKGREKKSYIPQNHLLIKTGEMLRGPCLA